MRPLLALALLAAVLLAGCGDSTPGATDAPPPVGGPPASDRHPPGLTDAETKSAR